MPSEATVPYRVIFLDNHGSLAVDALASSCDGSWRNAVASFDGVHDSAIIDVPTSRADDLEDMLEADPNVVRYLAPR